jgi:hypothetical protein
MVAEIKPNGTYSVENVPLGKAIVTVQSLKPVRPFEIGHIGRDKSLERSDAQKKEAEERMQEYGEKVKTWRPVPLEYAIPSTKKFVYDVVQGEQQFDLAMASQ